MYSEAVLIQCRSVSKLVAFLFSPNHERQQPRKLSCGVALETVIKQGMMHAVLARAPETTQILPDIFRTEEKEIQKEKNKKGKFPFGLIVAWECTRRNTSAALFSNTDMNIDNAQTTDLVHQKLYAHPGIQ